MEGAAGGRLQLTCIEQLLVWSGRIYWGKQAGQVWSEGAAWRVQAVEGGWQVGGCGQQVRVVYLLT